MEPEASSGRPVPGGSRGRGRQSAAPRTERKSLEVFGGAPASTRYLPGTGAAFTSKSVPEGVESEEPETSAVPAPPTMRIEPPWAPEPNSAPALPASEPATPAPPVASPVAEPEPAAAPMPWEINLEVPEYTPKPVIGSDENPAPKPVIIRHHRSSSDGLKTEKLNSAAAQERQLAIDKLKKQAEEDAKSDLAKKIDNAKKLAHDAAAKDAKGAKSPEKKEMSEDVLADRVAEWGLVLKADAETGKLQGVQTRRSGDRSSGDRR